MRFIAPAWKGTLPATTNRAKELMPSGVMKWGLDEDEVVFEAFAIPYQPVTVLIAADGTIFESWAGFRDEASIRQSLDQLVADGL
ncbi:MAG TPA: hypothetical protein VMS74_05835 [Acidimicrobiia bacterium]|nr:hypothetical protein [Acidimicrobiia bacterium]